jgi:hypothetical protein
MNINSKIVFGAVAAIGLSSGYKAARSPRGIQVIDCGQTVTHTGGNDPCYSLDACASKLECKLISPGVWIAVSPSGYLLWESGPSSDVQCKRVTADNQYCTGGTSDTFKRPTCGSKVP